jgi:D-serine deaminase-like pyridoxal phosphate-dependent protein
VGGLIAPFYIHIFDYSGYRQNERSIIMTTIYGQRETPCVLVDFDVAEANIDKFATYCKSKGIASRPHIKTHKLPVLAHRQVTAGAIGITCQKISEAEVMADAGIKDILITYNIVGEAKLKRLLELSARCELSVVADSKTVIEGLAQAFASADKPLDVLVECDTGAGRCGVQNAEQAVELATIINDKPGLMFNGLMTYPLNVDQSEIGDWLVDAKQKIEMTGVSCGQISSGGSPNMWRAHEVEGVTEHRAGTYVYYDYSMVSYGVCEITDCALTVMATIVSRPTDDRAIIDAGTKILTSDQLGQKGFGHILEAPDAWLKELNEEHGIIDLCNTSWQPKIGDQIRIIPNHACVVSNMVDAIWVHRGDDVIGQEPVAARGHVW